MAVNIERLTKSVGDLFTISFGCWRLPEPLSLLRCAPHALRGDLYFKEREMMTYQEQIKHPRWQKKRLEVLKVHKFKCQNCKGGEEELHVHHPYYKRGAMIWEYDKTELECLCHRCHKEAHAIDEQIKKALAICRNKDQVLDFILNLNGSTIQPPTPRIEDKWSRKLAEIEREVEEDNRAFDTECEAIYTEHPNLRPCEGDSDEEAANKFFMKMKLLMG